MVGCRVVVGLASWSERLADGRGRERAGGPGPDLGLQGLAELQSDPDLALPPTADTIAALVTTLQP